MYGKISTFAQFNLLSLQLLLQIQDHGKHILGHKLHLGLVGFMFVSCLSNRGLSVIKALALINFTTSHGVMILTLVCFSLNNGLIIGRRWRLLRRRIFLKSIVGVGFLQNATSLFIFVGAELQVSKGMIGSVNAYTAVVKPSHFSFSNL